ncbi:MAG: DUF3500 domain-containing protein [Pseudohongiellaceae bacterium]
MKFFRPLSLLLPLFGMQGLQAQDAGIELTRDVLESTANFLASLTESQREKARYPFSDEERLNWHFIPRERRGIPLKELDDDQLAAARKLLQTLLSAKGFDKTEQVRGLESVLAALESNGRFVRDPDLYYVTIFGEPAAEEEWAVRYEGHHLAFNWTFAGAIGALSSSLSSSLSSTPQFIGSNPAEVRSGPQQGLRVLAAEEDLARTLVNSLDQAQADEAIVRTNQVPRDILTGADKEVSALEAAGLRYTALNSAQRLMLIRLVEEVASTQPAPVAEARMAKVHEPGLDDVRFAWIGGTERGDPHYYRIQGTGFLIEYDNTQNDANHIHLVWRDFEGDFGRDLLRMHYEAVARAYGPGHSH